MSKYNRHSDNSSSLWGGVIILCAGLFFLLRKLDISLPHWLFSWEMLMVVIGFVMGIKQRFQGAGWFIVTAIGAVFLLDDIMPFTWHLDRFLWPVMLIVIGIYLIGRSATRRSQYGDYATPEGSGGDFLQVTSIFSGNNKTILSKNFKGGSVTSTFGGTELNFMQADIHGEVILDITVLFGSVELTVPANWDVKMDVNTVFGGIEDKRSLAVTPMPDKVLVLRGSCTFGGVELKSY